MRALFILLLFQLLGEIAAEQLRLPVPGPVIGMLLLFLTLRLRSPSTELQNVSQYFIQNLGLLFLPAGVGIFFLPAHLSQHWPAIAIAMIAGTFASLLVTSALIKLLAGSRTQTHGQPQVNRGHKP